MRSDVTARRPAAALAIVAAAAAALALCVAVAVYPATTVLVALVAGVVLLAWERPALGLAAAALLFAFEGTLKLLLGEDPTPLASDPRAVGAVALDIALFAAVGIVLWTDRLRTPRAIWNGAARWERVVFGVALAWGALSVLQIVQGGQLTRGLHGFRQFQLYTLLVLATAAVCWPPRLRPAAVRVILGIGLVVSLYAALRIATGMSRAEVVFATSVPSVTTYGDTVRAIGSFSSAIGMSTWLAPMAAFAITTGVLVRSYRVAGLTTGALALVGLLGSYSRSSLFGVALGLGVALVIAVAIRGISGRRRAVAAVALAVLLAGTYGGVVLASHGSHVLRERAAGIVNPFDDESLRLRLDTWHKTLDDALDHPLGQGVGAVGAASASDRSHVRTTDNSFLKVLVEQGVLGVLLFVTAIVGVVVVVSRRLRRVAPVARTAGLACVAGFVTFLGMSLTGETVEQPGKVLAWALLGLALACTFGPAAEDAG